MSGSEWVIGYAVEAGSPSSGTWRDTRIGGLPKWPPGPHPEVKKCPQCNRERVMLLQAFAPHAAHAERLLLIFVCNSAVCSRKTTNWCAFRAFRKKDVASSEKIECVQSSVYTSEVVDWNSDASESSDGSSSDDLESLLQLQNLQISSSNVKERSKSESKGNAQLSSTELEEIKPVYEGSLSSKCNFYLKPHFVEVAIEPKEHMNASANDDKVQRLLKAYKEEESRVQSSSASTQWDGEDDREETDAVLAVDSFRAKVDRAPEQVLRYKFDGNPVWPAHPPPTPLHLACSDCGSQQVFELQVLGSALFFLEAERAVSGSQREAALNFMAMALYTCKKDCEQDSSKTEDTEFQYRALEVRVQTDFW